MINFNLTSIVNLVGFIFFVLILYKLLYKPFLDVVAKRKEIISKSLSDAEKAKLDSEKIKEDMEKEIKELKSTKDEKILQAEAQAKAIIDEAKKQALVEKERIILKAEQEASELKEKAALEIQSNVVRLAVTISAMILKEKVDIKANEELARRAMQALNNKGESL